jgi:hypothetical protein
MTKITAQDRQEFDDYLRNCTDSQVQGVLEKEMAASRRQYVKAAQEELVRRGLA